MASFNIEILRTNVRIDVNETDGVFSAQVGDAYHADPNLETLKTKIRATLNKQRITLDLLVGLTRFGVPGNVRLTKRSARDGGFLAKDDVGDSVDPVFASQTVYKPWTPDTGAEFVRLTTAVSEAKKALKDFLDSRLYIQSKRGEYGSQAGDVFKAEVEKRATAQVVAS